MKTTTEKLGRPESEVKSNSGKQIEDSTVNVILFLWRPITLPLKQRDGDREGGGGGGGRFHSKKNNLFHCDIKINGYRLRGG